MKKTLLLLAAVGALVPAPVSAQDTLSVDVEPAVLYPRDHANLEVVVGLGIGDRSTTGIGDPLLGMGYDQSFGPVGSLDVRLFVEDDDHAYVRHGPVLRAQYHGGPTLGIERAAFRATTIDVGYSGRVAFPCMRRDDFGVYLGGYLAITGLVSDADRGDVDRPDMQNETIDAARRYDHGGLGGALGLSLDAHVGAFVIGLGVDLHQFFGIDSPVARDLVLSSVLRVGADVSL